MMDGSLLRYFLNRVRTSPLTAPHESEYIRSWSVQIIAEDREVSDAGLKAFSEMAQSESSALVRLYLVSALQGLQPV